MLAIRRYEYVQETTCRSLAIDEQLLEEVNSMILNKFPPGNIDEFKPLSLSDLEHICRHNEHNYSADLANAVRKYISKLLWDDEPVPINHEREDYNDYIYDLETWELRERLPKP